MRPMLDNERQLAVPLTVGPGEAKDVARFSVDAVQFAGAFGDWRLTLEGTTDGTHWTALLVEVAEAAIHSMRHAPKFYRLRINAVAVGAAADTPNVYLSGRDARRKH